MKNTSKTTEKQSKKRLILAIVAVMALLALVTGGACSSGKSEADPEVLASAADTIENKVSSGNEKVDSALDNYHNARSSMSMFDTYTGLALGDLEWANMFFTEALEACGDYDEFSEIKKDLEMIVNTIDDMVERFTEYDGDTSHYTGDPADQLVAAGETINTIEPYIKSVQEKIDAWQFD